jgi:hypothetical protein
VFAPWTPRSGSKKSRILVAAQAALDRYRDSWPLGSREVGYVLTGDEYGFTHDDVDLIEDVLACARRAGLIPWEAISDGRAGVAAPWTVGDADEVAEQVLGSIEEAQYERQDGQPYRVEVWAEAMGWLTRLERICNERGVVVHSGSVPVSAIRNAALRAVSAYPQPTVLLQIGDLDLNGIRNIARPFADDVEKFVADLLGCTAEEARQVVVVRRLLLTAEQVEEHLGERGRRPPSAQALEKGWPYPWTVQAEALVPPDVRDRIVSDAIDALHDVAERERIIASETVLHDDARAALSKRLAGSS